jgi:hypothetical protein
VQVGGDISTSGSVKIFRGEKGVINVGGKIGSSGGVTIEGDLTFE